MSAVTHSDVQKIAQLARLAVSEAELSRYCHELTTILGMVEQINQVDVSKIEPMAHPLDALQRLRPDVVVETDESEKFQSIAPQVESGLYLVPKVIESQL